MTWPIARESLEAPNKAIVSGHATSPLDSRLEALADRIALHIESLVPQGCARCLDIGRGDMTLAEAVQTRASHTDWRCIDVERMPSRGREFPYADGEFDVALLCDVLHLAPEAAAGLLAEAGRVARNVLVKDHFDYGPWSRTILQVVDSVGKGDGGNVAARYFTRQEFARLAAQQQLVITALDAGLDLYGHPPGMGAVLRRDSQFIAVLSH
jgi:hypothetical protein